MTNRILLADDSITIQKVVNRAFADEGIEVVAVSSGDQAERQIGDINPDLVLADIFMPGKNGYELCETIKQDPNLRHIPVVLLVGAFEPFDQAEARRVCADDHLTKPFEFRALIDTVRKLISTGGRQPTAPLAPAAVVEEDVTPLEPRPTGPLASPPFRLDLSAMTEPVETASSQGAEPDFPVPSFDDSAPLDLDYGGQNEESSFGTVDVELANDSTGGQTAVFGSPSWVENVPEATGQTASYGNQIEPEPLDLGAFGFAVDEPAPSSEPGFAIEQATQAEEESSQGFSVPSTFASDADSIVLDFEKSEIPESPLPNSALAFETEPEAVFEILTDEQFTQPSPEASSDETDKHKTRKLDPSAIVMPHWKAEAADKPDEQASASNVAADAEASFALIEPLDESGAEIFAVDDPLGDLLTDDGAIAAAGPRESAPRPEPSYRGFASADAFELQFNPEEQEASDRQVTASAVEQSAASAVESTDAVELDEPVGFADEVIDSRSDAPAPIESAEAVAQSEVARAAVDESQASEGEIVEATDWAKSPASFDSSAQSDVFADSDMESYSTGPLNGEAAAPIDAQTPFTSATMWSAEEARFAPIDIEAVPVEETEHQVSVAETSAEPDDARGFDFVTVAASQPEPAEAEPPVVEQSEPAETYAPESAQGAELSPAAMDEIVRRVMAQMSDSVVREIAWEVVPDVVERVIERLARESLSKKM